MQSSSTQHTHKLTHILTQKDSQLSPYPHSALVNDSCNFCCMTSGAVRLASCMCVFFREHYYSLLTHLISISVAHLFFCTGETHPYIITIHKCFSPVQWELWELLSLAWSMLKLWQIGLNPIALFTFSQKGLQDCTCFQAFLLLSGAEVDDAIDAHACKMSL